MTVTDEKGEVILYEQRIHLNPGLSYSSYDLSVQEKYNENFMGQLDEEENVKKADNGLFYLQPGKYKIEISLGDNIQDTILEITK